MKAGYSLDGIDKYEKVRSEKEQLRFQTDLVNKAQTNPLDRLAKGKKNAIILVDDLSRPTKAYKILPYIFEQLRKGGIEKNNISILMAIGAHRPLNRFDYKKNW